MSTFYMTIGLPGSGKSSWAKQKMNLEYVGSNIPVDWHSSDAIREEFSIEDNEKIFGVMRKRTICSIDSGRDCIYDATNLNRRRRQEILNIVRKHRAKRVAVLFLVPISECKRRNALRENPVPNEIYDSMIRRFDIPLLRSEFDEIIIIFSGKMSKEESRLFSDKFMDEFDQKNPHHTLTIGEHLKKTSEIFQGHFGGNYQCFVSEAARYHDVGKPYTFSIDEDGKGHFYGHEKAGAYWYLLMHAEDADFWNHHYKVAVLINWHMRPYVWERSEKALLRDLKLINKYDPDMYGQLINISYADRKAH